MRKPTSLNSINPKLLEDFLDAALDNFEKYQNSTIVIKFGGEMIANEDMLDDILRQAIKLKRHNCNVILVHGGGPQISKALEAQNIEPKFDNNGKRICDEEVLDVSYETLRHLNKDVVVRLNKKAAELGHDILAMGEAGYNGGIIRAEPLGESQTGTYKKIDADYFKGFGDKKTIPVIYTICMGPQNQPLNVNADDVAAGIAQGCDAKRMIMVTDVAGVWDENKNVVPELTIQGAYDLVESGAISGGMKPKIEAAVSVAQKGINVVITTPKDGGLFRELFTVEGSGTMILAPSAVEAQPKLNLTATTGPII